jgi:rubrerythrin
MADREKVIKGIEICLHPGSCRECPYYRVYDTTIEKCAKEMMQDALELLKEQQEQKFFVDSDGKMTPLPIQKHGHWISYGCGFYRCSVCDDRKNMNFVPNYCSTCGAKMDEKMDRMEVKQND